MTAQHSIGEVPSSPTDGHDRAGDLRAVVPVRAESVRAVAASLGDNVVPFARSGANDKAQPANVIALPADLSPPQRPRDMLFYAVGAALSVAAHAGVLAFFVLREEPPLASIGLEVISVEVVLGATAPAGAAPTPGESETQAASAPETQPTEIDKAEQKATAQPQDTKVAETETAPEVKPDQPTTEAPRDEKAAPDPAAEPQPAVAMVETPDADIPTAKPPEELAPPQQFSLAAQPQEPVEERRQEPATKAAPPKPVQDAKPAKERRRIAAPTREKPSEHAKASTPSSQANNVGLGRSSNDTNYRGLVAAHLARHKQFPAEARSQGSGGTASVTFTIGGSGGVTSVRLAHGSGVASIDAEVTAMVRRASPFPPPPGGRAQSFTVPVSFRLN